MISEMHACVQLRDCEVFVAHGSPGYTISPSGRNSGVLSSGYNLILPLMCVIPFGLGSPGASVASSGIRRLSW